jgi:5'-nucleotidase
VTATTEHERRSAGQRRRRERERLHRSVVTDSGAVVSLRDPDPTTISLGDIARGLAAVRRFNGRGRSVAEHSVDVARLLRKQGAPREVQLAGLYHDAAEAYTGDLVRPIKLLIAERVRRIEAALDATILQALGLEGLPLHDPRVKAADLTVLDIETGGRIGVPVGPSMSARAAERAFLAEHARLTNFHPKPVLSGPAGVPRAAPGGSAARGVA